MKEFSVKLNKQKNKLSIIVAINDDQVFNTNIMSSPELAKNSRHEILSMRGYKSASLAYDDGITKASNDIVVFVHQDVYLPEGWIKKLNYIIVAIEANNPSWGVLGCYGVTLDGEYAGHVYSNGLQSELGSNCDPVLAQSLDEMILIFKKSSNFLFDKSLPNFHMYGADICVRARIMGHASYIIGNFCVHNSVSVKKLGKDFWRSVFHFRRQYLKYLPIKTTCATIYRSLVAMICYIVLNEIRTFLAHGRDTMELLIRRKKISKYVSIRLASPGSIQPHK